MLKNYQAKFTEGALFICSKCGQGFSDPQPEMAEKLKTELRQELKKTNVQTKVRVMVSGCLGLCVKEEQTFAYCPNYGETEVLTASSQYEVAKVDILNFLNAKMQFKK